MWKLHHLFSCKETESKHSFALFQYLSSLQTLLIISFIYGAICRDRWNLSHSFSKSHFIVFPNSAFSFYFILEFYVLIEYFFLFILIVSVQQQNPSSIPWFCLRFRDGGEITEPYGLTRKLAADATAIKVIRVKFHWAWQQKAKQHKSVRWTRFDVVRALISTFGNIWVNPTISGQKGRWEKDLSVWMAVRVVPEISTLRKITGRLHHAGHQTVPPRTLPPLLISTSQDWSQDKQPPKPGP